MGDDYWVTVEHNGVMRDDDHEAAILFKADGTDATGKRTEEVWIPRSQIRDHDTEEMIIPRWLADDRGLDWEYE